MGRNYEMDTKKCSTIERTPPFPDYINYEGKIIYYCRKEVNFAEYLLPRAYLNHIIVLNKDEWRRHCVKEEY